MANANVLQGFACPKCGSDGPFLMSIAVWGIATVYDDGIDYNEMRVSETEFHDLGSCKCFECDFDGYTPDFQGVADDLKIIRKGEGA